MCAFLLTACGAIAPSPPASLPPQESVPVAERITAKTAFVVLRSTIDLGDGRILNVSSDAAPRGFAGSWRIAVCSVQYNELTTYEVSASGIVGKPVEEPYNPVFDDRSPPFSEPSWAVDSSDAARTLKSIDTTTSFFLEADDSGALRWEVRDQQGGRFVVDAGTTPVETPPPDSKLPRIRR